MFSDPKTTLTGLIGGLAVACNSIFKINIPTEAIVAVVLFLLGLFSKDATKTG